MKKWTPLPPHVTLTLTDAAYRTIELPILPVVIGRRGADVVVEHPSVDPEHARLFLAGGGLTVADLRSRNGTFVNGRRVGGEGALVAPDDALTFGAVAFRVGLKANSPRRAGAAVVDPNNRTVPASGAAAEAPPARPMLLVVTHHGRQRQFLLDRSVTVVGRMAEIRVADPALSRKHVQIEIEGDEIRLKDLASANGTFVNGSRISVFRGREEVYFSAGDSTFHLVPAQRR